MGIYCRKMIQILKKFGVKNRLDLISIGGIVFITAFVVIFKLFPDKFGIDWTKNKRQVHNDISIFKDKDGNFLPKSEGKENFFKMLKKTDEQILADKMATYYLRSAWIIPQFLPQFFNFTTVGGFYNLSIASTYFITHAIKDITHKERPDGGNYKSFPSGHTAGTSVLAGFVHRFYGIKLGGPLYIISAVVGGSRIFADRHDIYDVVAGFIVGSLCGFYTNAILMYVTNFIAKKSQIANRFKFFLLKEF